MNIKTYRVKTNKFHFWELCLVAVPVIIFVGLITTRDEIITAEEELQLQTKVRELVKREYEFDLTKVLIQRKGEEKPEVLVLEEIERDRRFRDIDKVLSVDGHLRKEEDEVLIENTKRADKKE